MTRAAVLLASLTKAHKVLEFGALDRPLVKRNQYFVKYVDFASRDQLALRLRDDASIHCENLVEVDIIWNEKSILHDLGDHRPVDFVVASHVFEHLPNPLGWLQTMHAVLATDGCISLAIPDKRFTFDNERPVTRLAEWFAASLERRAAPPVHLALDAVLSFCPVETSAAWQSQYPQRKLLSLEDFAKYQSLAEEALATGAYHDVHCSIFTPRSFVELMLESAYYGLHDFSYSKFVPTRDLDMEFFVELRPCSTRECLLSDWAKLLQLLP